MKDEQLTRTMREIIDMASRTAFKESRCTEEAVKLAKAYADARESKANNKIAEIRRLCKAFLYDLPCSHNVAVIGDFLDAHSDNKILDEFKKTVVAAKDAEIMRLREGVSLVHGLKESMFPFDKTLGFNMLQYLLTGKDDKGQCKRLLEESLPPPVAESEDKRHELRTAIESLVGIKYELESRNAALVAALQDVHDIAKDSILHGASRNDCARIFDKSFEAIAANTEKGGVQG